MTITVITITVITITTTTTTTTTTSTTSMECYLSAEMLNKKTRYVASSLVCLLQR